ncbi:MAG: DUF1844 domain-containing protein [Saprospiraceae bacterium]|nr:DUF1844 domain-containing protein [Pyrinomonadaceae bacterium]
MIGEENQEEVTFKVSDRRKFNSDGSVKDGVILESPKSVEAAAADIVPPEEASEIPSLEEGPESGQAENPDPDAGEIPGADDPASFVNFLSTLATNAAASLGAMPHPATGKRSVDLETGKYWLDVLAMLGEKTKSNLHPQEARLLEGILGDLRMQYVTMVRATEDKLKEQAAKQFSAGDILGKK